MKQASLLVVGALLALVGCRGERTVGPRTPQGATPQPAATAAPTKTFLSVSPTSLTFSGAGASSQRSQAGAEPPLAASAAVIARSSTSVRRVSVAM